MDRRHFLKRFGQAAAGIAVAPSLINAAKVKSKLAAYNSSSFHNLPKDPCWMAKCLEFDKKLGMCCLWHCLFIFISSHDNNRTVFWISECDSGKSIFRNRLIINTKDVFLKLISNPEDVYWVGKKEIWQLEWYEDINTFRAKLITKNHYLSNYVIVSSY
jgi:hypothetical protein